ncbi:MAG: GNAT family N-acetyltransferase [Oscillospiraceae bacterium]|nr:GNAT family N-acetyltransferase [Oscillospiraceae bacterium]
MIEVKTPRLIIRDWQPSDHAHWHRLFSNTQNMRFVEHLQCHTLEESRKHLQGTIDAIQESPRIKYFFAMQLRDTSEFIGNIGFMTELKAGVLWGNMGWFLLPEHQGYGYAAEAFAALIPRMFEEWGVAVIDAGCNIANKASECIMQACGMKLVQQYDDRLNYQLKKEDWLNL